MPAVLTQATYSTLLDLLTGLCGLVLICLALFPKQVALARETGKPPIRVLLLGLVDSLAFVVLVQLWKTGSHMLKLLGAAIGAVGIAICVLGMAGLVQRMASRLERIRGLKGRRIVSSVIALLILIAPIAIPYLGWYLLSSIVLLASAGAGVSAIIAQVGRRQVNDYAPGSLTILAKVVLGACGLLLVCFLSPVISDLRVTRYTIMLSMADGKHLATDIYLPYGKPPFPTILIRTPYNKDAQFVLDAVKRGYAVVVQDTRGRNASEGTNTPLNGDTVERPNDGWETLEFLSNEGWCDRNIGTMGGSAEGISQIAADGAGTDRIKSQYIPVAAPSLYQYVIYPGGILRKNFVETWLSQNHYAPESLKEYLSHPDYDEYWLAHDFGDRWDRINWPAMHVGGWYDIFSQGTLDTFVGFQTQGGADARDKQKLIMGPWGHNLFTARVGEETFPGAKAPDGDIQDPWRWFDYTLKHQLNGVEKQPAVTYYVMGDTSESGAPGNVWRSTDIWPPDNTVETSYYLHAGKALSTALPGVEPAESYSFDPAKPVATLGGPQSYLDAGPRDQRSIVSRPDVLTFLTSSLPEPQEVTGRVSVKLFVSSDAPDTDFFIKLCDVYPDGRIFNVCEGQLRARFRYGFLQEDLMKPGEVYPLDIDLWSTSIIFNKGHKIAVLVTSSNSPAYDVNPNTGDKLGTTSTPRIAHNSIYMDSTHPSAIILPVARK